jgi:hypothetical protein
MRGEEDDEIGKEGKEGKDVDGTLERGNFGKN